MTDYWLSTKSPARMFRPSYENAENDAYLIENQGVDSAMLALDMKICRQHVEAYQRRLGLRAFTKNSDWR